MSQKLISLIHLILFNCRELVIKPGLSLRRKVDSWETSRNCLSCCSSTSSGCRCSPLTTPMRRCSKKLTAQQRVNCHKDILVRLRLIFLLLRCTEMEFPYPSSLSQIFWTLKENVITFVSEIIYMQWVYQPKRNLI